MTKERFKTPIAVYLILKKDNQILLHLRRNTGFADGFYSLVAGHLDGNETATQAMIREAKEEANIILDLQDLKVVHVMHRIHKIEYIDIFVQCSKWTNQIKNMEPHKCGELIFVDRDSLPENTLDYVKLAVSHIDSEIRYSEFGW